MIRENQTMNASTKLIDFLHEHSDDKDIFLHNVEKYGVGHLLYHELESMHYPGYADMLGYYACKMQNKIFRDEIVKLSKMFAEKEIKIIFLKGLPLAQDVYSDPDLRKSSDIDVFVDYSDMATIVDLLSKEGYLDARTGKPVIYDDISKYVERKNIDTMLHLNPVYKNVDEDGMDYILTLELHISIFPFLENKLGIMAGIIKESVVQDFYGSSIYVLEVHDRLIHLLTHLVKDYFKTGLDSAYMNNKESGMEYFDLRLLHDIALIIEKYGRNLDWNLFLDKVSTYKKSMEVFLACRLVEYIYGRCFTSEVLGKLEESAEVELKTYKSYPSISPHDIGYLWLNTVGLLPLAIELKIGAETMLRHSSPEVIGEILKRLPLNGSAFSKKSSSLYVLEGYIKTADGEVSSSIVSTIKDGVDVVNLPSHLNLTNLKVIATGEIAAVSNGISINLRAEPRNIISFGADKFIFEFVFYYSNYKYLKNFQDIAPKIIFGLSDENKLYHSVKNAYIDYTKEYEGEYFVERKDDLVELYLILDWGFLDVDYNSDTEILFDIAMMHDNLKSFTINRYKPRMEYLRKLLFFSGRPLRRGTMPSAFFSSLRL